MKKNHSIYLILLSFVLFASCKKGIDTVEVDSTVYLPQSGLTTQTVLLGDSEFSLGVYKAGINQKDAEVTVTIGLDELAGSEFILNNPGYEILPSSYYTLPDQTVLIDKNSEREFYRIKLKGIDETFTDKKYFLPISITSASNEVKINEAKKSAILQFTHFRNVYESKYKAYGTSVVSGTPDSLKLITDEVITVISVNASTIQIKGPVTGLNLLVSNLNNQVQVTGAVGSEAFLVQPTSGKTSTYAGQFNVVYQSNTGTFMLYYTYTVGGVKKDADLSLSSTI